MKAKILPDGLQAQAVKKPKTELVWYVNEKIDRGIGIEPEPLNDCLVWDGTDEDLERLKKMFHHLKFYQVEVPIVEPTTPEANKAIESVGEAAENFYRNSRLVDINTFDKTIAEVAFKAGSKWQKQQRNDEMVKVIEELGDKQTRVSANEYWYRCALHDIKQKLNIKS